MHKILGPIFFPISKSKSALNSSMKKMSWNMKTLNPIFATPKNHLFLGIFAPKNDWWGNWKSKSKGTFLGQSDKEGKEKRAFTYFVSKNFAKK